MLQRLISSAVALMWCLAAAIADAPVPTNPPTAYPSWWFTRGVIAPLNPANSAPHWPTDYPPANDFAALNQGQLKQMASAAFDELQANCPGGAGADVTTLIKSWYVLEPIAGQPADPSDPDSVFHLVNGQRVPLVTPQTDDYSAVNLGQIKTVAQLFYGQLITVGYTQAWPWTNSSPDDFAAANIGQMKNLFSFDLTRDTTGNGIPDWWLVANGLNPADPAVANSMATDGSGLTNLQEYQQYASGSGGGGGTNGGGTTGASGGSNGGSASPSAPFNVTIGTSNDPHTVVIQWQGATGANSIWVERLAPLSSDPSAPLPTWQPCGTGTDSACPGSGTRYRVVANYAQGNVVSTNEVTAQSISLRYTSPVDFESGNATITGSATIDSSSFQISEAMQIYDEGYPDEEKYISVSKSVYRQTGGVYPINWDVQVAGLGTSNLAPSGGRWFPDPDIGNSNSDSGEWKGSGNLYVEKDTIHIWHLDSSGSPGPELTGSDGYGNLWVSAPPTVDGDDTNTKSYVLIGLHVDNHFPLDDNPATLAFPAGYRVYDNNGTLLTETTDDPATQGIKLNYADLAGLVTLYVEAGSGAKIGGLKFLAANPVMLLPVNLTIYSNQLTGVECNKLPTGKPYSSGIVGVVSDYNNPMIMGTQYGTYGSLAVALGNSSPDVAAGLLVGIRQAGTDQILGHIPAQADPNDAYVYFDAASGVKAKFLHTLYEVVLGYDYNRDGNLDSNEIIYEFAERDGIAENSPQDKIIIVENDDYQDAMTNLNNDVGGWAGALIGTAFPNAAEILRAFIDPNHVPAGATATTFTLYSNDPGLKCPIGAYWVQDGEAGKATANFYTFSNGSSVATEVENSAVFTAILEEQIAALKPAAVAFFASNPNATLYSSPSKNFHNQNVPFGTTGRVFSDLNLAFGTINDWYGSVQISVTNGGGGLKLNSISFSSDFTDLADFYIFQDISSSLLLNRSGAVLQAGNGTLGTAGRVFESEVEFSDTKNAGLFALPYKF